VNSANAMPCTNEQIQTFKHSGYLVIENLIEPDTLLVHGASINVRAEPRFGMVRQIQAPTPGEDQDRNPRRPVEVLGDLSP
jgi:hypothetical protein